MTTHTIHGILYSTPSVYVFTCASRTTSYHCMYVLYTTTTLRAYKGIHLVERVVYITYVPLESRWSSYTCSMSCAWIHYSWHVYLYLYLES